jgi:hypothetical protein
MHAQDASQGIFVLSAAAALTPLHSNPYMYSTKCAGFSIKRPEISGRSPHHPHQQVAHWAPHLQVYTVSNSLEGVQDLWLLVVRAVHAQVVVVDTQSLVVEKEAVRKGLKAIGGGQVVAVVGKERRLGRMGSGLELVMVARFPGVNIQREVAG